MSLKRFSHLCRWCVIIGHEYIMKSKDSQQILRLLILTIKPLMILNEKYLKKTHTH